METKQTKHTPGPWEADTEVGPSWAIVRMGKDLVQVHAGVGDHYKANARLIAAAPELLAACEAALKQLGGDAAWLAQCGQGQVAKGINDVVIPKLLAAIRKATT